MKYLVIFLTLCMGSALAQTPNKIITVTTPGQSTFMYNTGDVDVVLDLTTKSANMPITALVGIQGADTTWSAINYLVEGCAVGQGIVYMSKINDTKPYIKMQWPNDSVGINNLVVSLCRTRNLYRIAR
jgi:hypothetical protein